MIKYIKLVFFCNFKIFQNNLEVEIIFSIKKLSEIIILIFIYVQKLFFIKLCKHSNFTSTDLKGFRYILDNKTQQNREL